MIETKADEGELSVSCLINGNMAHHYREQQGSAAAHLPANTY